MSLTKKPGATATHPACIEGAVWRNRGHRIGTFALGERGVHRIGTEGGGAGALRRRHRGGASPERSSSTELPRPGAPTPQPSLCDARPPAGPAPVLHANVSYAYCLTPIPYVWPPIGARVSAWEVACPIVAARDAPPAARSNKKIHPGHK